MSAIVETFMELELEEATEDGNETITTTPYVTRIATLRFQLVSSLIVTLSAGNVFRCALIGIIPGVSPTKNILNALVFATPMGASMS
jgi:hypothetical protein